MAKGADSLFLELARRKGLLDETQAAELLGAREESSRPGPEAGRIPQALAERAVESGRLTRSQAHEIQRELLPRGAPRALGRYEIVEELGKGGMGSVYKAWDPRLEVYVAIKTLVPQLAANGDFIVRFEREARLGARLRTPHAIRVFDVGEEGLIHYIVMDYIEGESLAAVQGREGRLDEERACAACADVARALHAAHKHGVIHRDIKPANIMVDQDGTVKVADLGIAKQVRVPGADGASKDVSATTLVLGTASYMSPEQADGDPLDFRSDIFSLGATLYHLVCGQLPYTGNTSQKIMRRVATGPVPDPRRANPALSEAVAGVLGRMMAKDPAQRYQTHAELIADLESCAQGRAPISHRPPLKTGQPEAPKTKPDQASREKAVLADAGRAKSEAEAAWSEIKERNFAPGDTLDTALKDAEVTLRSAETLFELKVLPEARAAYEEVITKCKAIRALAAEGGQPETSLKELWRAGWTAESERVRVAAAEGDHEKEITYYVNSVGMTLALIPAGSFETEEAGREGRHAFGKPFHVGVHAVTNGQYEKFLEDTGYDGSPDAGVNYMRHRGDWRRYASTEPDYPVVAVSWKNAQKFCEWLTEKEGVTYRLPTEAEWEYACRAGSRTEYYWGDHVRDDCAWYKANSRGRTHPVGQKLPNAFGLCDMSGNVWEWCRDWHQKGHDAESASADSERSPESGRRVLRGGSWFFGGNFIRSASRLSGDPSSTNYAHGFRVAALF